MKDRNNNYASTKSLSDIVDDVSNKVDNNYDIDGAKAVRYKHFRYFSYSVL